MLYLNTCPNQLIRQTFGSKMSTSEGEWCLLKLSRSHHSTVNGTFVWFYDWRYTKNGLKRQNTLGSNLVDLYYIQKMSVHGHEMILYHMVKSPLNQKFRRNNSKGHLTCGKTQKKDRKSTIAKKVTRNTIYRQWVIYSSNKNVSQPSVMVPNF